MSASKRRPILFSVVEAGELPADPRIPLLKGAISAVAAAGLAVLLIIGALGFVAVPKAAYKAGFFVALAVLYLHLSSPRGFGVTLTGSPAARVMYLVLLWLPLMPYILLIEIGLTGYLGFSSSLRYISLALAVLGFLGAVATLIFPRALRRRGGEEPVLGGPWLETRWTKGGDGDAHTHDPAKNQDGDEPGPCAE